MAATPAASVALPFAAIYNAAAPATWGAAILVPLAVVTVWGG